MDVKAAIILCFIGVSLVIYLVPEEGSKIAVVGCFSLDFIIYTFAISNGMGKTNDMPLI